MQSKFMYCYYGAAVKANNHCEVRSFPEKIAATDMVKFSDGLYIVGYAKDSIYATMDFENWYQYSIADYKTKACTLKMFLGKYKSKEALYISCANKDAKAGDQTNMYIFMEDYIKSTISEYDKIGK